MCGGVSENVVIDYNGNMVLPTDHEYASVVPMVEDKQSRQSLIRVITNNQFIIGIYFKNL